MYSPLPSPAPGADSKQLIETGQRYYVPNYKPREMILDHGKGARLWDLDGNDYVDFAAGIAVSSLGHQDPDLLAALTEQAQKLWHTSNVFFTTPPIRLCEALVRSVSWGKRAYLCNSGTEANEAAIKLVRKYAADRGKKPEEREIITFAGSFHGRTLAAVTATVQSKYQQGFEPLPGGFVYCPKFNDLGALAPLVTDKTAAVMLEPVQGEGGVIPAAPGFLKGVRELCDQVGALLVFDEIQSGVGRTGYLYAHEEDAVIPDVMTLAKGLGGGMPVGAMVVGEKAENTFVFGSHGSTFGGNPVMAAVALAALTKIARPELLADVTRKGAALRQALAQMGEKLGIFTEVRGRGLMLGAQLAQAHLGQGNAIADAVRKAGLLVLVAGPDVIRIVPPLTITDEEIHDGLTRLEAGLTAYLAAQKQG